MRLIDADALKELIWNKVYLWDVVKAIDAAPTVDAEPVIRCKDCAFYWYHKLKRDGSPDKRYSPSHCYYWGKGRSPNEYCSRAMDRVSLKNAIEEMIRENKRRLE